MKQNITEPKPIWEIAPLSEIKSQLFTLILGAYKWNRAEDGDGLSELVKRLAKLSHRTHTINDYKAELGDIITELILIDDLHIEYQTLEGCKRRLGF